MNDDLRKILTADDQLDDVGRARVWSRLEDRIAVPVRRARVWPIAAGFAACAAAAIAVWLVRRPAPDAWVAPANATLTMRIGPHTDAALIGPGRLRVIGEPGDVSQVRLERGTLLAEFTGGAGRALHVDAPGMQVDVVGTLFSVEVAEAQTCVAVVHGRVRAVIDERETFVDGGQQACSHDAAPRAIEPRMREMLERHANLIVAAREPAPAAAASPPPSAPPAPADTVVPAPADIAAPAPPADIAATATPNGPRAPATSPNDIAPRAPARASQRPTARESAPTTSDRARAPAAVAATTSPAIVATTSPAPAAEPPAPAAETPTPTPTPTPSPPSPMQPAPVAAPAPPQPASAEELYHSAELALAKRDDAAADRAFAQLIANAPSSPLVGQALYDRARIAYAHHDWPNARRHLAALASRPDTALAESGHYLTCRIAVDSHDRDAARCFTDFRTAFPRSAHDRDVLGTLAQLAFATGGCSAAHAHVAELASRYPHSALAAAWAAKCPEPR